MQNNDELFIGACDNGFDIDLNVFEKFKKSYDAIMISHTNDTNIENNPNAHSWALLNKQRNQIKKISLKKTVSKNFMQDHATTGMFWFKNSSIFVEKLEKMIGNKDTLNGKYYLDNLLNYLSGMDRELDFLMLTTFVGEHQMTMNNMKILSPTGKSLSDTTFNSFSSI